ncbi:MAG TPA: MFS transporter [Tepidisphaeraceae bacterium]|jgi:predicted MFS family arabinose efflux permease|nr:MFS transporter [Tepidisphaeraceae bacterium]
MTSETAPAAIAPHEMDLHTRRERFVHLSAAITFLIFFQTYMIAPLIPSMAIKLHTTVERVGFLVPAYTLPYAAAGLICGALADRIGRRIVFFASMIAFPFLSLLMSAAPNIESLIALRALSGLCNAGLVIMALVVIGDRYPISERGRAIGWIFGAIAGGGAFGSTVAGLLAPLIAWRGLFILTAAFSILLLIPMLPLWKWLYTPPSPSQTSLSHLITGYFHVLKNPRAARTYLFIYLNGIFHSGVFTWIGVLLHNRYNLGPMGIGLVLLGYGVPGFLLGPYIGRIVDHHGRRRLIPIGLAIGALGGFLFVPNLPLLIPILAAPILSLGFDMSHPLLAGISSTLDDNRRGQAMGFNAFAIFFGFGTGALLFALLSPFGIPFLFLIFSTIQIITALTSIPTFKTE